MEKIGIVSNTQVLNIVKNGIFIDERCYLPDFIWNSFESLTYSIDSFIPLNKPRTSETAFCNLFRCLLQTILKDSSVDVIDGENVPESTRQTTILDQYDSAHFGKRIDLIVYETYHSKDIWRSSIEFKKGSASSNLLGHEQSKTSEWMLQSWTTLYHSAKVMLKNASTRTGLEAQNTCSNC